MPKIAKISRRKSKKSEESEERKTQIQNVWVGEQIGKGLKDYWKCSDFF